MIIWPFLTSGESLKICNNLDCKFQEKIRKYAKVYTANYTKYNLDIEALHGTIEDFSNIYINEFVLAPVSSGKKEYIRFMSEKYHENKILRNPFSWMFLT